MDGKKSLHVAQVKAATQKKPYVKPGFEVINLEDTLQLLAASKTQNFSGSATQYRTLSNGSWDTY